MLTPMQYLPGVVKDDTEYSSSGYAVDSDKIRFVRGKVESLGGYEDHLYGVNLEGIARGMHSWVSVRGVPYLAVGTHRKLYAIRENVAHDITPIRDMDEGLADADNETTVTITHVDHGLIDGDTAYLFADGTPLGSSDTLGADPVETGGGSSVVSINIPAHGMADGDLISFDGFTPFNGITLSGLFTLKVADANRIIVYSDDEATASGFGGGASVEYTHYSQFVATRIDDDEFTVELDAPATISAEDVEIVYEMSIGNVDGFGFGGYSYEGYSEGPFGFTRDPANKAEYQPRTWSMDSIGQFLVANPLGGFIYLWTLNLSRRAARLQNSPDQNDFILVTAEGAVMSFGCTNTDGVYDPLIIRHSDLRTGAGTPFETWMPAPANNAGEERLDVGSTIVGAVKTKAGIVVLTDTSLHFGQFVGSGFQTYGFKHISSGCGLAGPNALVEKDGACFWFTPGVGFYRYDSSSPVALPCPVRRFVTENVADNQEYKIYAAYDAVYDGIYWLYPEQSDGNREVNRYVRLDINEMVDPNSGWSVGTTDMTAWLDRNPLPQPFSARVDGMLCEQEVGRSANGEPVERRIEYAPIELNVEGSPHGTHVVNVSKVIFDATAEGDVDLFMRFKRYPNSPVLEKGPYPQDSSTPFRGIRGQGRQAGFLWRSYGVNDRWRFGSIRFDVSQGPRR